MAAHQWDDLPGLERGSQYSSEVPQPCNPHRTGSDPIRPSDQRMDLHRTAFDVGPIPGPEIDSTKKLPFMRGEAATRQQHKQGSNAGK